MLASPSALLLLAATVLSWTDAHHHRAEVDPHGLVEFEPSDAGRHAVRELDPKATGEVVNGARVWTLDVPDASALLGRLRELAPGKAFSPLLHELPKGHRLAPSGGVEVTFRPSVPEEVARASLVSEGLEVEKRLAPHAFLVRTNPGLEAFAKARACGQIKGVLRAVPLLWTDAAPK